MKERTRVAITVRSLCLSGMVILSLSLTGQSMIHDFNTVEKLGHGINTSEFDEASPVVDLAGRHLYFTRTGSPDFDRTLIIDGTDISSTLSESAFRKKLSSIYSQVAGKPVQDPYISPYNQDIHVASILENVLDSVSHPGAPLNNALPNSVLSAAGDTNSLMVINQFYESGTMKEGLSLIEIDSNGNYGFPKPVYIYEFYNKSGNLNLALNRYGTVMVLSMMRNDTRGENDLYVSFKIEDDLWSKPVNLGDDINTKFQESTPFITQDGRYLYFASDRPESVGGMDIWVSNRLDYTWKRWSKPERLAEPINSEYDDGQAYLDERGDQLYFSSRRDGTSDIFRVSLQPRPELSGPIKIKCRIVDGDTGKPIRAEVYYGPESAEGYLEYYHTYTGLMEIELYEYDVYKFFARKANYQPAKLKFDARLADMQDLPVHHVVLKLFKQVKTEPPVAKTENPADTVALAERMEKLGVGQKLSFYDIYFVQSKPEVLPKSHRALDELVDAMKKNPGVTIRVEGHTDNVGNEKDLLELSWQRAEAIKSYLVDNGVDKDRVATIGFGGTKPVKDNMTEANRRQNRRVEISITAK